MAQRLRRLKNETIGQRSKNEIVFLFFYLFFEVFACFPVKKKSKDISTIYFSGSAKSILLDSDMLTSKFSTLYMRNGLFTLKEISQEFRILYSTEIVQVFSRVSLKNR